MGISLVFLYCNANISCKKKSKNIRPLVNGNRFIIWELNRHN